MNMRKLSNSSVQPVSADIAKAQDILNMNFQTYKKDAFAFEKNC